MYVLFFFFGTNLLFQLILLAFFIKIDKKKNQVKVEAGALLEKLNEVLDENNMALSVLGAISDQTIAGTLSCGTHGTGVNYGIISSFVSHKVFFFISINRKY